MATEALALDSQNNLTIAGDYTDAAGVVHGFTLTAGVFRRFDVPNGQGTAITGLNDARQVVGRFQDGATVRGFVGTLGATAPLDFVGNRQLVTLPGGINSAGHVGGTYVRQGAPNGFLFGAGDYVLGEMAVINDINDQGAVAGSLVVSGALNAAFGVPIDPRAFGPSAAAGPIALPAGTLGRR